jgi:hypothetical protein
MSQEADVNNCFDSAFLQDRGQEPDPDKNMSTDYSIPPQQVQRILYLTSTCLSAKGYSFIPTQALVNQCSTVTVLAVLQIINANTKQKTKLPLVLMAATVKARPKGKPKSPGRANKAT